MKFVMSYSCGKDSTLQSQSSDRNGMKEKSIQQESGQKCTHDTGNDAADTGEIKKSERRQRQPEPDGTEQNFHDQGGGKDKEIIQEPGHGAVSPVVSAVFSVRTATK